MCRQRIARRIAAQQYQSSYTMPMFSTAVLWFFVF